MKTLKLNLLALALILWMVSCAPAADNPENAVVAPKNASHQLSEYGRDWLYEFTAQRNMQKLEFAVEARGAYPEIIYTQDRMTCTELPNPYEHRNELFYTARCKLSDLKLNQRTEIIFNAQNPAVYPYFFIEGVYNTLPGAFPEEIPEEQPPD